MIVSVLLILGMLVIYEKFSRHGDRLSESKFYKQYLVTHDDLSSIDVDKPMLWIHVTHDQNARWWRSFYSRNSSYLNQPYQFLTMNSVIEKNKNDFNVAIIDDDSFASLLPGWKHDLTAMADPIRSHIRQVALTKVLAQYGGMLVPSSFACSRPLINFYRIGLGNKDMFVCENQTTSVISRTNVFYPDVGFMGCVSKSPSMMKLNDFLVRTASRSYSDEPEFSGEVSKFCATMIKTGELSIVDGQYIGVKKTDGSPVTMEDLFGTSIVRLHALCVGIWLPQKKILDRLKYGYFVRMSAGQIMKSNEFISRVIQASEAHICAN